MSLLPWSAPPVTAGAGEADRSQVAVYTFREVILNEPRRHFSDDLLRGFAVGTASEGARLAVACHTAFCSPCREGTATHEATLDLLLGPQTQGQPAPAPLRTRLMAELDALPVMPAPSLPSAPRASVPLPADLPQLPPALSKLLLSKGPVAWRTLVPGIRAIDLEVPSVWRARLVRFRPGLTIPIHDHGGPEHTVVFSGGLVDAGGHLGPGDAATMFPGESHTQRAEDDQPCVALIINEAPARPLTTSGRFLKWLTRS